MALLACLRRRTRESLGRPSSTTRGSRRATSGLADHQIGEPELRLGHLMLLYRWLAQVCRLRRQRCSAPASRRF